MTVSEALQVFGSEISGQYFSSTTGDYESFTLSYVRQYSDSYGVHSSGSSWTYDGQSFLLYTASNLSISSNPQYISLDIQPTYSIFDTEQIHTVIAMHSGGESSGISTTFQSPSWDWYFNGSSVHLENSDESETAGTHAFFRTDGRAYQYVCADFSSTAATSGYSYRATFFGHSGSYCYLLIGLPYISDNASGATGTFTSASGGSGGDTNINVNVDMSETNEKLDEQTGLLQSIKEGISGIFESIKNALVSVFVPDSDFMDEFKSDMQTLLSEHLGGLYQAIAAIDDIFERFAEARAKGSIHIDAVNIPLAGETLTLGNWDVPLKVDGLNILYDGIAFIIDFIAVAGFLNMCRNKLEIFLNPDSEVIGS